MKITLLCSWLIFLMVFNTPSVAQNIAINVSGANADTSAMLDVSSTNKGILITRVSLSSMTTSTTIPLPATGLLVYNTNTSTTNTRGVGFYYNAGTSGTPNWVKLVTTTDTVVQTVTPSGLTIKLDRFPMGEVSMNGNSTITNISAANVWAKAAGTTLFSTGSYQFSNGGINNRLQYTGPYMKMFHIACTISVKSSASGSNLKAVIYKNGLPLNTGIIQAKMGSSTDIISTAIHVMTDLSNNDYLELWITNTASAADFTITEMNLFCMGVSMGMDY